MINIHTHTLPLISFAVSLLAILNPIGNVGVLLSLVGNVRRKKLRHIVFVCITAVAIVTVVTVWVGLSLLHLFGISIAAFQIAGGIIIFYMGFGMLQAKTHSLDERRSDKNIAEEVSDKTQLAVIPLAIPIIAGPGAISTIILATNDYSSFIGRLQLSAVTLVCVFVLMLALLSASIVAKHLGEYGMRIFTRLMGLILSGMAVQMLIGGLLRAFPHLFG